MGAQAFVQLCHVWSFGDTSSATKKSSTSHTNFTVLVHQTFPTELVIIPMAKFQGKSKMFVIPSHQPYAKPRTSWVYRLTIQGFPDRQLVKLGKTNVLSIQDPK